MGNRLRWSCVLIVAGFGISLAPCVAQQLLASAAAPSTSSVELPNAPSFLGQQAATTGLIDGQVTDAHGGLVPEASVTLSEKGRTELRETTTDSSGHFRFNGLGAGAYTVLVSAPQFRTYHSSLTELQAGEHLELPTIALAVATADTSISVSADSEAVAEQELKGETKQRIVGIIPNFYTSFVYDAAPLNTRQKFKLNLRGITDPTIFLGVAAVAGIEQYRNTFPEWGNSDAASYGKRFGAAYGDAILRDMFSYALYPSIFHQDPRYFYLGPTNKKSTRLIHALTTGIITRGDSGHAQLNYSHLLGSASGGAVSSLYHPRSDGPGYLAGINLGIGIGSSAAQAVLREFLWPRFTTHVPAYATGKTPPPATPQP